MRKNYIPYLIALGVISIALSFLAPALGGSKYLKAAKAGGDYLVTHLHDDGSFVYEYDPLTKEESDGYNILRHAGTTYALLELYETTRDEKYREAAELALGYLRAATVPCPLYKDALCVLEADEIKLGGGGLALLAFAKYMEVTGARDDLALAEGIARFITSVQARNGDFIVHKMDGRGVPDSDFTSEYYPGEAMFGLSRFSKLSGDATWSDAANRAARFVITVRDRGVPTNELPHDHWFLYALNDLSDEAPDLSYVEHAKRLVTAIVAAQHSGREGEEALWNGGYYTPPRSTPTATRNEGLGAAYALFMRAGDAAYAQVARGAMEKGVEFTLQTQFTRKSLAEAGAARDALGAFHEGLDDYTIRIDYVQHNISALLAFDKIRER
jgi:hypothetical protein